MLHCPGPHTRGPPHPGSPHPGLIAPHSPVRGRLTGTESYRSRTFLCPLRQGHAPLPELREASQSPASRRLPSALSPFPASSPHRQPQPSPPFRTRSGSDAQQPCVRRGLDLRPRSRPRPAHDAASSRPRARAPRPPARRACALGAAPPPPPARELPAPARSCAELPVGGQVDAGLGKARGRARGWR